MFYNNKSYHSNQSTSSDLLSEIVTLIAHKTNFQPKVNGRGFILRCPAHEDRKPSLSVSIGTDGRVLLKCFCGCTALAICEAIGKTLRDLFPKKYKSR